MKESTKYLILTTALGVLTIALIYVFGYLQSLDNDAWWYLPNLFVSVVLCIISGMVTLAAFFSIGEAYKDEEEKREKK